MNFNNDNAAPTSKISASEIKLPKGGGAIKGLGDSFRANLFSGAGSYSIPIPITSARGFEPELNLSYSSGGGNGIFGLGFSLSLSKIAVKTNLGIPKYDGADQYELDGTTLAVKNSTPTFPNPRLESLDNVDYRVTTFLTAPEINYELIERWSDAATGGAFWKVIAKDNTISLYGRDGLSRVSGPEGPLQVFEWLIDQSTDAKGNKIVYTYVGENDVNQPPVIYEVNRNCTANRYISQVNYGNYFDKTGTEQFAFGVVFDYGQGQEKGWAYRPDPFSFYKSGFEIRTCRLCLKIQVIHHFPDELGDPLVVKELCLEYENTQAYGQLSLETPSKLTGVVLNGYRKESAGPQRMPPLRFGYSAFIPPAAPGFDTLNMGDGTIPGYLDQSHFLPVDLNGEGLPGFVFSDAESSFYLEPMGDGRYQRPVAGSTFPVDRNIQGGGALLADLDADGQLELIVHSGQRSGYYARNDDGGWDNFVPFAHQPTDIANPSIESVGLSANGKSDLLLADTDSLQVYPSLGKQGYGASEELPAQDQFPLVKQDYRQELVTFANVFGDGLSHRVKIGNGYVECWPCLGGGRFGKKVLLAGAPVFDERFDTKRLFLTDVDGSGTADLVYVYPDRVALYLNQSGNSFSEAITLYLPEQYDTLDQVNFMDILGNGTSCLVFTKIAPTPRHYYYNFSGEYRLPDGTPKRSLKPYLLNEVDNNLGVRSFIDYGSSTQYLLADKAAGNPWTTKLPFPVQVVDKIITYENFTKSRYLSHYRYRDGYYDPFNCVFRGFGLVESWEGEDFDGSGSNPALLVPPIHTKTWYLNGGLYEYNRLLAASRRAFFSGDAGAYDFPDSLLPDDIGEALEQAYLALAGKMLRKEIYAKDGSALAAVPYSVEQTNYLVGLIQSPTADNNAVFRIDGRESIHYDYEREKTDPRVQQQFVLETDAACGLPTRTATVFIPRRGSETPRYDEQYVPKGTAALSTYYSSAPGAGDWLNGINYDQQQFELIGLDLDGQGYFSFDVVDTQVKAALDNRIAYMAPTGKGVLCARLFGRSRSYFWDEDQQGALPLGAVSARTLLHHVSTAAFTKDNISTLFGQPLTEGAIEDLGGYIYDKDSGYWENQGLVQSYYKTPQTFYLPSGTESSVAALGMKTDADYDAYYLTPVKVTSYVSVQPDLVNVVQASIDYQTMAPYQLVDINGNVSQALFDAMGQVTVCAVFGQENQVFTGDMLLYDYNGRTAEYIPRTVAQGGGPITFDSVNAAPAYYLQGAGGFFYYDLNAPLAGNQPVNSIGLEAETYYHQAGAAGDASIKTAVVYNDGLGRVLQTATRADAPGFSQCWIVSGRSVYNSRGKVCESYLPFFSTGPAYQNQGDPSLPPPTITHYDALLRTIRVDTPKGFFSKTTFTPWEQVVFDEDDTVKDAIYYQHFMATYPSDPTQQQIDEKDALDKAAAFYDTPTVSALDNMGHTIRTIRIKGPGIVLTDFIGMDITGRTIQSIDPRLYASNLAGGTQYYNFKYAYGMNDGHPLFIDSVDAGVQRYFHDIFGNQVWSMSPRNYCQVIFYDLLQRKTQVKVLKVDGTSPVNGFDDFNLVETFTYGEGVDKPAGYNLRGQVYQLNDLSGVVLNSAYSLSGAVLNTSRQMAADYKTPIDWNKTVPLQAAVYATTFAYDARNRVIRQQTPDGSITTQSYNTQGLLQAVGLENGSGITNISYNASGQRTQVNFGNATTASFTYEFTTQRLVRQLTQRAPGDNVQDINYTYDPVGNVTRNRDLSIATVFNNNQKIEPLSDYTYSALYQLIQATGRQHPGISAGTFKNNSSDGSFMQSLFSQLPVNDGQAIETYQELYTYDDSDNLVKKQHIAASNSWTTDTVPLPDSNRLQGETYDDAGNQRTLSINNTLTLVYNCCNNLVSVPVITRPNEPADADYYVYDSGGQRSRKVSERLSGTTSVLYEDTLYLGNYLYREKGTQQNDGTRTSSEQRQTLRIMDGDDCVLMIHHWVQGGPGTDQHRYQLGNNLGSVAMELDEQAQLISYEEYFPYGGTSIIAGTNQVEVSEKMYRYAGKECDNATGLYYYGRRYYVSWLGRWLNPDPAGTVNGSNLFAYVKGNPVTFVDKTGLAVTNPLDLTGVNNPLGAPHPLFAGNADAGAVHFGMNAFGGDDANTIGNYGYRDAFVANGTGIIAETSWEHIFARNSTALERTVNPRQPPLGRIGLFASIVVAGIAIGAQAGGSRFGTWGAIVGGFVGAVAGIAAAKSVNRQVIGLQARNSARNAPVTITPSIGAGQYVNRRLAPSDLGLYQHVIGAFQGNKNVVNVATAENLDVGRLGIRYSKGALDYVFANQASGASIHFHLDGLVIDNGGANIDFSPSYKNSNVASGGGGLVKDTVTAHELRYLARRFHRNQGTNPNVTFYLGGVARPGVNLPHHNTFGSRN